MNTLLLQAPMRKWVPSGVKLPDGKRMFTSTEWPANEKQAYLDSIKPVQEQLYGTDTRL